MNVKYALDDSCRYWRGIHKSEIVEFEKQLIWQRIKEMISFETDSLINSLDNVTGDNRTYVAGQINIAHKMMGILDFFKRQIDLENKEKEEEKDNG